MSDPSPPDSRNSRSDAGRIPWESGGVPANLTAYLKRHPRGGRVLVPGCGSGHEIKAFAEAGYEVTALDLAPAAVERVRAHLGPELDSRVLVGDFFQHDLATESFDLVYERTFVRAILPDQRVAYRTRVARLLKYRGSLLGYFFYQAPVPADGPPFGFAWGSADELFARYFLLGKDIPVDDSLPMFAGRERWQEWHRTSYSDAAP